MKILAFGDTHGSERAFLKVKSKILKHTPDLLICLGDISVFEQNIEKILKKFSKFGVRMLITHGNHETPGTIKDMVKEYKTVDFLHDRHIKIGKYVFIVYGGGGFSLKDEHLEKKINYFKKIADKSDEVIIVTHAPPYNTKLDIVLDSHCGSKTIRKLIKKISPSIAIVGHLHENEGLHDFIGDTRIVNPGPYGMIFEI